MQPQNDDELEQLRIGDYPEPGNPGGVIDADRVETSSGTAPTGGMPVGSAADRIQPDRSRWLGPHTNPDRPANSVDNLPEASLDGVPSLTGVAGATPSFEVGASAGTSLHMGGLAGVSPRTGMTSGAVMGDVGSGMAGEEEMDLDPDAD